MNTTRNINKIKINLKKKKFKSHEKYFNDLKKKKRKTIKIEDKGTNSFRATEFQPILHCFILVFLWTLRHSFILKSKKKKFKKKKKNFKQISSHFSGILDS
jgi:hypothetical protein